MKYLRARNHQFPCFSLPIIAIKINTDTGVLKDIQKIVRYTDHSKNILLSQF